MKKLLFLIGTRPEAIKIAPLFRTLQKRNGIRAILCTSGQQDTLLSDTLSDLALTPTRTFRTSGDLAKRTGECMLRFDKILEEEMPDGVFVHGDTLTAFAGGLPAFYRHIPVFHVEAGLRSGNPFSPFPEEFYRRAIDHLASLHFAPTVPAAEQLMREGIAKECIHTVGNTAIDGLWDDIDKEFPHPALASGKKLLLLTLHRRESIGAPLEGMLRGIASAIETRKDVHLFFPMHPNPHLRAAASTALSHIPHATLCEPVDLHTFHNLLSRATLTLTDSGGVSEEATALGTPTLLLRDETERSEGVAAGVLHLVGRKAKDIEAKTTDFLDHPRPHTPSAVFGDGRTSQRILKIVKEFLTSS